MKSLLFVFRALDAVDVQPGFHLAYLLLKPVPGAGELLAGGVQFALEFLHVRGTLVILFQKTGFPAFHGTRIGLSLIRRQRFLPGSGLVRLFHLGVPVLADGLLLPLDGRLKPCGLLLMKFRRLVKPFPGRIQFRVRLLLHGFYGFMLRRESGLVIIPAVIAAGEQQDKKEITHKWKEGRVRS